LEFKITKYFQYTKKRADRINIKNEWIIKAIKEPIKTVIQYDGRIKKWAKIDDVDKYLRVILFLIEILRRTNEYKIFSRYWYSFNRV